MNKKFLIHPLHEILLAIVLLALIAFAVHSCVNRYNNKGQAQINEMLEYHSAPDQLTIECNGYIKIRKAEELAEK